MRYSRIKSFLIINKQKGASVIAILAIMLILAVMGAALVSLVTKGSGISINQLQSEQAFNIAEGGIEKALTRFVKNNTPCASLVYTNSLGAGSFTTTPTLHTASIALFANITAADTVIPVGSTAGYASHGRIRIDNEDINYAATSTSCAPFASPDCFTGALRGVAGSTAVLHNAGAGVNTAQEECLIRSTGIVTNSSAQRIVEKGIQIPSAMIVYAKANGNGNVFFRRWDGTDWGPERTATAVPADIHFFVLKFARTRNEAVLGTLSSNGDIRVQVWNGNTQTWSATTLMANVGAGADSNYRSFDIEYETFGDRAIIVYKDFNGSADPDYRIWDGTIWSGTTNIIIPTTGEVRWVELAPHPSSSEIVMLTLDNNIDVYGMRWPGGNAAGTPWNNMGVAGVWDNSAADSGSPSIRPSKVIDVAYEQLSGRAMFIWGDTVRDENYYRIWDGATLSPLILLDIPPMGDEADWVRLVSRPNSNELMYSVQDGARDLNTALWSGAAWTVHARHDANTEDPNSRNFDIAYETNPANAGQAWLMWGSRIGADFSRRRLWDGAAWGAITNFGDDGAFVQLAAHPVTGVVFASIYQDTGAAPDDITSLNLTGAGWSAETSIWGGPTVADPVLTRVTIATERFFPIINWREIYP